jgi:hypothetical protein
MRQDQTNIEVSSYEKADRIYMDEGLAILDLCQRGGDLFAVQAATEKRRLIEAICLNSTWKDGSLSVTWRKPFDELAEVALVNQGVPTVPNFEPLVSELYDFFLLQL